MKIPSPYRSYPPRWQIFDEYVNVAGADRLGFAGSAADVNRFAARYRAAKCFKMVDFDELTAATAAGYSALVQLLLTYSAFEHFMRCIGSQLRNSHALLEDSERDRAIDKLRTLQGQDALFGTLRQHLDPPYKRQVDAYLQASSCNPFYLAAAIRHAFAHGLLAAAPGKASQEATTSVCKYLSRVLMHVMDREFLRRMVEFESGLPWSHR